MKKLFTLITILLLPLVSFSQTEDSVFVIISGDIVHIWNTAAYENCGCLFRMDVVVFNDTIYVTEVDTTSNAANCNCYFDLCASITGLQGGTYLVKVSRYMPLFEPDTVFIASTSFNYCGSTLAFGSQSFQSDCYDINEVKKTELHPNDFVLGQNYPNPFNPTTTIKYQIPKLSFVTLKVYDVLGREIETLVDEEKPAGSYQVEWSTNNLSSGVYFYTINATGFIETKKMLLIR